MKTFGKVVLIFVAIFLLMQVVVIFAIVASKWIPPRTVLTLRLSGDIPEQAPQDPFSQLFGGRALTVAEIAEALDRARTDSRIAGVELRIADTSMNMGKIQEIRDKLVEFNSSGKFSVAYLEYASNASYYLASASATVFLLPMSEVDVHGWMASTTFMRGTFEKLGIHPDFYHIGAYKNATNVYTETRYTAEHREATEELLKDWYGQFLAGIASDRAMKVEQAKAAIEKGPFTSEEALAHGLVDHLGYLDEVREVVREKAKGSDRRMTVREYLRRSQKSGRTKLAVIVATGVILPGSSGADPLGGQVMGSDTIAEQFRAAREDGSIKAVVLRVDSPGGSAFSSEVIRREVELTERSKPVVVSMSDVAASGGYWISMSAARIVAEPGTVTGSIGVLTGKFNLVGLYSKLGLTKDFIALSENSTIDYPFQNFTPAQRESILRTMHETYQNFIQGVAAGRHMKPEAVDRIGQGHIWSGARAKELGLVDELGGLDTAVQAAKKLARIPRSESVELIYLPRPKGFFEMLAGLSNDATASYPQVSLRGLFGRLESLMRLPVWALEPAVPQVE
jgi:protease IV